MATYHPIRLWHLTSLDAPTVAVTWLLAFAWSVHIHLPLWLPITLALITWSTYIGDRLLDAHRASEQSQQTQVPQVPILKPGMTTLRPRHRFHWQYRKIFLPTAIASALAAILLIHHNMPPSARERNTILAAATLAYFSAVHNPWRPTLRIPKEPLVAILFTLACTLPTLTRMNLDQSSLLAPILAFIALAWLNCKAIEAWESTTPASILKPALILVLAATLSATTISLVATNGHHHRIALLLATSAISAALLALLDHQKQKLQPTTLRALADLVLLTPLALLFLPK